MSMSESPSRKVSQVDKAAVGTRCTVIRRVWGRASQPPSVASTSRAMWEVSLDCSIKEPSSGKS